MKSFKDDSGSAWVISINVDSLERVAALAGIDLTKLFDGQMELLGKLVDDLQWTCRVLWVLVGEGRTRAEFAAAMSGDTLERAINALIGDVIDFFPSPQRRQALRLAVKTVWQMTENNLTALETALHQMASTPSKSATDSLVLSESIPDH